MLRTLWIMRHGLAVDQFDSDFSRALSQTGERQAANVIDKLMLDSEQRPRDMLVSPFVRTQSTARIVHQKLALNHPYETEDMLVHFADHKILGDFLLASSYRDLMIVSHMPIVARLCQYLVPGCDVFGFQTAQVVKVVFDNDNSQQGLIESVYLPD